MEKNTRRQKQDGEKKKPKHSFKSRIEFTLWSTDISVPPVWNLVRENLLIWIWDTWEHFEHFQPIFKTESIQSGPRTTHLVKLTLKGSEFEVLKVRNGRTKTRWSTLRKMSTLGITEMLALRKKHCTDTCSHILQRELQVSSCKLLLPYKLTFLCTSETHDH